MSTFDKFQSMSSDHFGDEDKIPDGVLTYGDVRKVYSELLECQEYECELEKDLEFHIPAFHRVMLHRLELLVEVWKNRMDAEETTGQKRE